MTLFGMSMYFTIEELQKPSGESDVTQAEVDALRAEVSSKEEEVEKLRKDMRKKEEVIAVLEQYQDPTGCIADRLKKQQNLDRMAQENMKWANCNVRVKKLTSKVEQLQNETANCGRSDCSEVEKENHYIREANNKLRGAVDDRQNMINEYQGQVLALQEEKAQILAAEQTKIERVNEVVGKQRSEMFGLEQDKKKLKEQCEGKVTLLMQNIARLENKVKECDTAECPAPTNQEPAACDDVIHERDQLKQEVARKVEAITILEQYNDPSGCINDRLKQQLNMDRLAQENMRWSNCNVGRKKLQAKLDQCQASFADEENTKKEVPGSETGTTTTKCDCVANQQQIDQLNTETNDLRMTLNVCKKNENEFRKREADKLKVKQDDSSDMREVKQKLEISEEKVREQTRIMTGQTSQIQKRSKELKLLQTLHERALTECCCTSVGEGPKTHFLQGSCDGVPKLETEADVTSDEKHDDDSKECDVEEVSDGAMTSCEEKLKQAEMERYNNWEKYRIASGKHTECKMGKHNVTAENLHLKSAYNYAKKKLAALEKDCQCEAAVTSCETFEVGWEDCKQQVLNCENTLKLKKEKLEKFKSLYETAYKNYTELRVECSAYYHDYQVSSTHLVSLYFQIKCFDIFSLAFRRVRVTKSTSSSSRMVSTWL